MPIGSDVRYSKKNPTTVTYWRSCMRTVIKSFPNFFYLHFFPSH